MCYFYYQKYDKLILATSGFVAVSGILFVVMKEKRNVGEATTDTSVCNLDRIYNDLL